MNQQLQREIARKGGQAAHEKGTAHEFDSEEARRAGKKGGVAVSRDREHMAEIGRRGGESRQAAVRKMGGSLASDRLTTEQQGEKKSHLADGR
jgi:general stress protein YciG